MNIHKFFLNGLYILLDVNSGAIHSIDELVYDIMDTFDGGNDSEVIAELDNKYPKEDILGALTELHQLKEKGMLFSPPLPVPPPLKEKPLVKSLCLHISHDCNLRCKYCFATAGTFGRERSLMPREVGEAAVDFIIKNSGLRSQCEIDFFGGEPLLNIDTVRHVTSYAKSLQSQTGKQFTFTLTTNAVLLSAEIIDYLNAENISLVLSLDGRKEVNDQMRPYPDGSGSYDLAVANIKQAVKSRQSQNYYVRGTFTARNLDFAEDVMAMAGLGFDKLSVEPVVCKDADYQIKDEHLPVIYGQYEKLAEEYLNHKLNGEGFEFFHFNLEINNGPCLAKRLNGCGAGHEYFAVTPEGDLYPCHQFVGMRGFKMGDVFSGIVATDLVNSFREAHVLNKPACNNCWARFYCSGGCHANAQSFNGSLNQPYETGCMLQKKRLECAIMIKVKLALDNLKSTG